MITSRSGPWKEAMPRRRMPRCSSVPRATAARSCGLEVAERRLREPEGCDIAPKPNQRANRLPRVIKHAHASAELHGTDRLPAEVVLRGHRGMWRRKENLKARVSRRARLSAKRRVRAAPGQSGRAAQGNEAPASSQNNTICTREPGCQGLVLVGRECRFIEYGGHSCQAVG